MDFQPKSFTATMKMSAGEIERRVLDMCDIEKRRIGQDLHDSIGQQLTGISLISKALEQRMREAHYPEADSLKELAEIVDQTIDQIRNVVSGLAPSEIQSRNAETALETLCERIEQIHHIRCTFNYEICDLIEDPDTVKNLYFVATEAINNAIRHGEADQIDVHLRQGTDTHLGELMIRNNGCCDIIDFSNSTRIGLDSMRFRAEALNGQLDIERHPDRCVSVICSFQIPSASQQD
ncbi:MAG: hypothetical protein ISR84_00015 [Kiritimatiellales bacterium]|nr:hypothetical protein [Kiritimatiellota bacterium]MBL7015921.1 hypothetical protein [Kiritimatiellales bacterium]